MTDFQSAKSLVLRYQAALDAATSDALVEGLAPFVAPDWRWRGLHPFHERTGPAEVAEIFWSPLKTALSHLHRREDAFFAGLNDCDDGKTLWVVSMGHFVGLHDAPWLGIPPTSKLAFLRYAEFHRIEKEQIAETALFVDIPHLMTQAGVDPFPPMTGAQLVQPGPLGHRALLYLPQDATEGTKTLALINRMVRRIGNWDHPLPLTEELALDWHDDMIWWGPTGIGATYTIERYARQHAGPFRAAFTSRKFNGHVARIAEGHYGGFFGWPNLTLVHGGGFMGLPGSERPADMRVVDIYRRDGDKLAENWVFIDLLHWLNQQGVDVLARMRAGL